MGRERVSVLHGTFISLIAAGVKMFNANVPKLFVVCKLLFAGWHVSKAMCH